ncbi:GSCOCG00013245001-RA-CDS [Cotesia congregata]|nr:GSCOCG00013245001-RA-CDS [Cotesia congregata]
MVHYNYIEMILKLNICRGTCPVNSYNAKFLRSRINSSSQRGGYWNVLECDTAHQSCACQFYLYISMGSTKRPTFSRLCPWLNNFTRRKVIWLPNWNTKNRKLSGMRLIKRLGVWY